MRNVLLTLLVFACNIVLFCQSEIVIDFHKDYKTDFSGNIKYVHFLNANEKDAFQSILDSISKKTSTISTITFEKCVLAENFGQLKKNDAITSINIIKCEVDEKSLDRGLVSFKNVKDLAITESGLINIPKSVFKMQSLLNLNLNNNFLYSLPKSVNNNTQLKTLMLKGNGFNNLDNELLSINLPLLNKIETTDQISSSVQKQIKVKMPMLEIVYLDPIVKKVEVREKSTNNATIINTNDLKNSFEVKPIIYTISNGNTPSRLTYPNGSSIIIPANSLVDINGNPITKEVNISYREFPDLTDIIINKIDMQYDSGGVTNQFRSAAMFEISAKTIDNQEVFIKKGEQITVNTVKSDSSRSNNNFYQYNEKTGNWEYKSSIKVNSPAYSNAWKSYRIPLKTDFVEATFEERFNDFRYLNLEDRKAYGIFPRRKFKFTKWIMKKHDIKEYQKSLFRNKSYLYLVNKKLNDEKQLFLYLDNDNVLYNHSNSEVQIFGRNLILNPIQLPEEFIFSKKGNLNIAFNDIRIYNKPGDTLFTIKLKSDSIYYSFDCNKELYKKAKGAKAIKIFDRDYKRYEKRLVRNANKFNRKSATETAKLNAYNRRENETNWRYCQRLMSVEEKAMTRDEWEKYAFRLQASNISRNGNLMISTFTTNVLGFGLYNCDQIIRMRRPVQLIASYTVDTMKIAVQQIYVIDQTLKSVFNFYGPFCSIDENTFTSLLIIDTSNQMFCLKKEDYEKQKSDKVIKVKKVEGEILTPNDLKKQLGLL